MGMQLTIAVILFAVSIGFMIAEIFLPTHGILAIASIASAIGGVIFCLQANVLLGLIVAILVVIAIPVAVYKGVVLYPQTPVGKRILLNQPTVNVESPVDALHLVGKQGRTLTMLRPAGSVEIDHQRWDVVSESTVIDIDKPVEVVSVSGTRIIVREISATS